MPKGKVFSEEERVQLQEIILKHKDIVENKQLDNVSLQKKKSTWEIIAIQFNSNHKNTPRNVGQLRKLWDNIKFRRKAELAAEKRLIETGGGPTPVLNKEYIEVLNVKPDPDLDSCGIDIEIPHTSNSNTIQMLENQNPSLEYVHVNEMLFHESECPTSVSETVSIAASSSNPSPPHIGAVTAITSTSVHPGRKEINTSVCATEEEISREKASYLLNLEKELGEMRKEEQRLRIELLKQQLETARRDEECQAEKRKLEIEILKNKLQ